MADERRGERNPSDPEPIPLRGADAITARLVPNVIVFLSAFCLMVMELVASRLVASHLGSSIYTWTSVIGVFLAGLGLGNYIGGKLADRFVPLRILPHQFLIASILGLSVVWLNTVIGEADDENILAKLPWWSMRVLTTIGLVFFAPSCALGTISPVAAKLALERCQKAGTAIGNVYAWGQAGAIVGTFLTGFVLIAQFGTRAIIWSVSGLLAVVAVSLASSGLFHAVWAGAIIAGCIVALAPAGWGWAQNVGATIKAREEVDEGTYIHESNYYRIKIHPPDPDGSRTLVLDNLIHGYSHPTDHRLLKYDYEGIYSCIMERAGAFPIPESDEANEGRPKTKSLHTVFLGGGSYTYPRYIQQVYPGSTMLVCEIDPAVTEANHQALFLPRDTAIETRWGDARNTFDQMLREQKHGKLPYQFDFVFGDAFNDFNVPYHLVTVEFNEKIKKLMAPGGVYMINIIDDFRYSQFLGAYIQTARKTFPGVAVFSTDPVDVEPQRDTFVIAMSNKPLDWTELGKRPHEREFEWCVLTDAQVEEAVRKAGGKVLTDDYSPVENLLAPVARDR
jgi:spermidine synthase